MSGPVEFLAARLDEDEADAHLLNPDRTTGPPISGGWDYWGEMGGLLERVVDSKRLQREVEAKRAILARYQDCLARMEDPDYPAGVARDQAREYEDFVIPNLITAWDGHPDYDPDWAP